MIEIYLKSKITNRVIRESYTARQLLENFMDEDDLMQDMAKCDCQLVGETNVVECSCEDEWEDYTLIVGSKETISDEDA